MKWAEQAVPRMEVMRNVYGDMKGRQYLGTWSEIGG
jgi:hypothetical protein